MKTAPLLGEHTAQVLENWLGLSEREIEGLAQDKIVSQRVGVRPLARRWLLTETVVQGV